MSDTVADKVADTVDEHPWMETVARAGWFAKGVVYTLMGIAAWSIAYAPFTSDDKASPQGVLRIVAEKPGGRALLVGLGVGLVLYAAWRLISVATVRGWKLKAVAERAGFLFSALFYSALSVTALRAAARGTKPDDPNTIERLSQKLLRNGAGRVLLIVAGVVVIGVAAYFVYKSVSRTYADSLTGVSRNFSANDGPGRLIWVLGLVGWFARGLVTGMLGFFVLRAAWIFHPGDAHGFDAAFRDVAGDHTGRKLVLLFAVGLVVYGIYCIFSAPHRKLAEGD